MESVERLSLGSGGEILFEASPVTELSPRDEGGPVQAGRLSGAASEMPTTLVAALAPVREAAETVLDQLRKAKPSEVEVTFDVRLSAQFGALISKGEGRANLKVRVLWKEPRE
ncbi:CU044_2847 family protein [Streptomyces otsuchiensis]|uniref:CU044_2847 family protein n=1 Tax=Streptomyces otsuchiensis TaxID=2681388 RepID=UPI001D131D44|nr:CU044_2847 family protein [Streptomyces otsuchiensis]